MRSSVAAYSRRGVYENRIKYRRRLLNPVKSANAAVKVRDLSPASGRTQKDHRMWRNRKRRVNQWMISGKPGRMRGIYEDCPMALQVVGNSKKYCSEVRIECSVKMALICGDQHPKRFCISGLPVGLIHRLSVIAEPRARAI